MMRSFRFLTPFVAAAALFGAWGCTPTCPPSTSTPPSTNKNWCLEVAPEVTTMQQGCGETEWVARLVATGTIAGCLPIPRGPGSDGEWGSELLFGAGDAGEPRPADFLHYCRYTWQPDDPAKGQPDTASLRAGETRQGPVRLDHLTEDCPIVSPVADPDPIAAQFWERQREAFLVQTEVVRPGGPAAATAPAITRVAVVDTAPTEFTSGQPGATGAYAHGRTVGLTIRELSCFRNSNCTTFIANHLALGRAARNGATTIGTRGDLAVAIRQAVVEWDKHNINNPPGSPLHHPHLVINLSLGWEESPQRLSATIPTSQISDAATASVKQALEYARCRGALIVAAAGNSGLGPVRPPGPMYPGAWEQSTAPDKSRCTSLGLRLATQPRTNDALLRSVGGLDAADVRLADSRPKGRPPLNASAAFVVMKDPSDAAGRSPVLTGTSMAAAVVSAAVASAWSVRVDASPFDIDDAVYKSGEPMGATADYCLGAGPCSQDVRRASVCRTVRAVCAGSPPPATCPATIDCDPKPKGHPTRMMPAPTAAQIAAIEAVITVEASAATQTESITINWPCHAKVMTADSLEYPARPCAANQLWGALAVPFVYPQPPVRVCPTCLLLKSSGKAYVVINHKLDPDAVVKNGSIRFIGTMGPDTIVDVSEQLGVMTAGQKKVVIGLDVPGSTIKATIMFEVTDPDGNYSSEDELLLY